MCGVYMIENKINHNKYIGASKDIDNRFKQHRSTYEWTRQPNKTLYQAFKKYGIDNFNFIILEECPEKERFNREKYYIQLYDTYNNGYNETLGGEGIEDARRLYGDNHPLSLISEDTALSIIQDLSTTRLLFKDIAIKYNCSEDIIKDINSLKTHKYLHNYQTNIRNEAKIHRNSSFEKLTETQVLEIIDLLKTTNLTSIKIAEIYNVSKTTIRRINYCITWNYLHNYKYNIREETKNEI